MVLDEPNSNLDDAGELALLNTIRGLQARKATVVVITHRVPILQITNKLLLLQDGAVRMFGPSAEVMQALQQPALPAPANPSASNDSANPSPAGA